MIAGSVTGSSLLQPTSPHTPSTSTPLPPQAETLARLVAYGRDASGGVVGSNQKRYAELRSNSTQTLDSELTVSVRLSEVSEEGLEAGW